MHVLMWNIIVARKEDENNKTYQKIVDAYQTEDTVTSNRENIKRTASVPGKHSGEIRKMTI